MCEPHPLAPLSFCSSPGSPRLGLRGSTCICGPEQALSLLICHQLVTCFLNLSREISLGKERQKREPAGRKVGCKYNSTSILLRWSAV